MPIQHAIWTVGSQSAQLTVRKLASEKTLEDMIVQCPAILSSEWMLISVHQRGRSLRQPEHRLPAHRPEVAPHRRAIEEIIYELGSAQPEPVG